MAGGLSLRSRVRARLRSSNFGSLYPVALNGLPGAYSWTITRTFGSPRKQWSSALRWPACLSYSSNTDRGTRAEKRQYTDTIPITLARSSTSAVPIDRKIPARAGSKFTDAKLGPVNPAFSNLKLTLSPDGHTLQITGSLSPTAEMVQAQAEAPALLVSANAAEGAR